MSQDPMDIAMRTMIGVEQKPLASTTIPVALVTVMN